LRRWFGNQHIESYAMPSGRYPCPQGQLARNQNPSSPVATPKLTSGLPKEQPPCQPDQKTRVSQARLVPYVACQFDRATISDALIHPQNFWHRGDNRRPRAGPTASPHGGRSIGAASYAFSDQAIGDSLCCGLGTCPAAATNPCKGVPAQPSDSDVLAFCAR
jgi:hypothetical protein